MITSRQFVNILARNAGVTTSEAADMLAKIVALMVDTAKNGDSVNLQGFGTFELKEKAEKRLFNPKLNEYRIVPASKTISFRASAVLKEKLTAKGDDKQ